MIPGRIPAGVNCKIVPPFQKNRLLIVLNPFKEKVGPLPAPISVSNHPLWENNLLQPKFIPPTPENDKFSLFVIYPCKYYSYQCHFESEVDQIRCRYLFELMEIPQIVRNSFQILRYLEKLSVHY